jgi:hypothetical protein
VRVMTSGLSTTTECCDSVATALPHRETTSQREGRIVFMAASRRRAPRPLNNPRGNSRVPTPYPENGARRSALCES